MSAAPAYPCACDRAGYCPCQPGECPALAPAPASQRANPFDFGEAPPTAATLARYEAWRRRDAERQDAQLQRAIDARRGQR